MRLKQKANSGNKTKTKVNLSRGLQNEEGTERKVIDTTYLWLTDKEKHLELMTGNQKKVKEVTSVHEKLTNAEDWQNHPRKG